MKKVYEKLKAKIFPTDPANKFLSGFDFLLRFKIKKAKNIALFY
jgi:hypothetical protein